MCGFCLSLNDGNVDIRLLTESIKHRGPDSTKYFAAPGVQCGFNRLAIVDNDPRSDQPMLDRSGRYLLLFNGEIYNFRRLRAALESKYGIQFVTMSDTEVLLEGLIHEGTPFVAKLDGIFAFAFVDLHSLDTILARDVFGVKPLYYFLQDDRLYVGSEIRPLLHMSGKRPHLGNLARYLSRGTVGGGETIVTGVNEIEPNTVSLFRKGSIVSTTRVHDFVYDVDAEVDIETLRDLLYSTIESQKPAIKYGVLFSGGLDSSLILSRCADDKRFATAYSVDVNHADMSERPWQDYAASLLAVDHRVKRVVLDKQDLSLENMAAIARGIDHPLFHPNYIGSYLLTRAASEDGLKVLLSGEGADELFLGYRWFYSQQPAQAFLEYVPLKDICAVLGTSFVEPAAPKMSLLEVFQKIYLQRWLTRQDLTGMANSVEVRVPFLGLELARVVNRISLDQKMGKGQSKWIIKALMSDQFSAEFLNRKKVGFDFPLNDWIGDEHIDYLRQRPDLIEGNALGRILADNVGSFMRNRIVFSLVALALWSDSLSLGRRH